MTDARKPCDSKTGENVRLPWCSEHKRFRHECALKQGHEGQHVCGRGMCAAKWGARSRKPAPTKGGGK